MRCESLADMVCVTLAARLLNCDVSLIAAMTQIKNNIKKETVNNTVRNMCNEHVIHTQTSDWTSDCWSLTKLRRPFCGFYELGPPYLVPAPR